MYLHVLQIADMIVRAGAGVGVEDERDAHAVDVAAAANTRSFS